jgi:hypothetical protein
MGESKRRKAAGDYAAKDPAARTWATGKLRIEANDNHCFDWEGTRQDAIDSQRFYLDVVNTLGISAESYAKRAAGYLMAFGMPQVNDPDQRPSNFGGRWEAIDISLHRAAVLWLELLEHVPNTGKKLEDVFVGKSLTVFFIGDKDGLIDDTVRELKGQPLSGEEFQMAVAVLEDHKLDPDDAVSISMADISAIMGRQWLPEDLPEEPIYVPRIPRDAKEADAMMQTLTVLTDTTRPGRGIREYAGYTNAELLRGQPGVRVR